MAGGRRDGEVSRITDPGAAAEECTYYIMGGRVALGQRRP